MGKLIIASILASTMLLCCGRSAMADDKYYGDRELKMVAFGDSITAGMDIIGIGSYPSYNWSTGSNIDSHSVKLMRLYHVQVTTLNVAIPFAPAAWMPFEFSLIGSYVPDYATIDAGANDICQNYHMDIIGNIKRLIDDLIKRNPNIEIILMPIPNITTMPYAVRGRDQTTCRAIWSVFCPYLLGPLVSDEQRYVRKLELDGINYSLGELAAKYPKQVRLTPIWEPLYDAEISTYDCFHPSIIGQQRISDLTFFNP